MLIQPKGADKTSIKQAPQHRMKAKHKHAPELVCKTLPDGKDGRTLLTPKELFALLQDPQMREAVDLVERVTGSETAVKAAVRTQFKNDFVSKLAIKAQKRAIDLAISKKKGMAK